jgi:ferredoxin-type protein NapG
MEQKQRTSIGLPRVNMDLCLLGNDRECSLCRNWCPYEAITLEFSQVEYTLTPKIDPAKCPGCGACQAVCPTTPEKAIVVVPEDRNPKNED